MNRLFNYYEKQNRLLFSCCSLEIPHVCHLFLKEIEPFWLVRRPIGRSSGPGWRKDNRMGRSVSDRQPGADPVSTFLVGTGDGMAPNVKEEERVSVKEKTTSLQTTARSRGILRRYN